MKGIWQKSERCVNLPPGSVIERKYYDSNICVMDWLLLQLVRFFGRSIITFRLHNCRSCRKERHSFILLTKQYHPWVTAHKAVFATFGMIMYCFTGQTSLTILLIIIPISFGLIFSNVWSKSASPNNIMAGFWSTGIYPYDPNIILNTAFAPSEITSRRATMMLINTYLYQYPHTRH